MPLFSRDKRIPVSDPDRRRRVGFAVVIVVAVVALALLVWAVVGALAF